jgi:hypothetical protein
MGLVVSWKLVTNEMGKSKSTGQLTMLAGMSAGGSMVRDVGSSRDARGGIRHATILASTQIGVTRNPCGPKRHNMDDTFLK